MAVQLPPNMMRLIYEKAHPVTQFRMRAVSKNVRGMPAPVMPASMLVKLVRDVYKMAKNTHQPLVMKKYVERYSINPDYRRVLKVFEDVYFALSEMVSMLPKMRGRDAATIAKSLREIVARRRVAHVGYGLSDLDWNPGNPESLHDVRYMQWWLYDVRQLTRIIREGEAEQLGRDYKISNADLSREAQRTRSYEKSWRGLGPDMGLEQRQRARRERITGERLGRRAARRAIAPSQAIAPSRAIAPSQAIAPSRAIAASAAETLLIPGRGAPFDVLAGTRRGAPQRSISSVARAAAVHPAVAR